MMHVTESFAYVTQAAHFVAHQAEVSGFTAAASMYIEQAKGTALSKTVLFYVGQAQSSLWAQAAGKIAVSVIPQLTTLGLELGTIGLGVTSLGALGIVCICIVVHKKRITHQSTSTLSKQKQQSSDQEKNSTDERKDTSTPPKGSSQNTNFDAELEKRLEKRNKKDSPDQASKNTEGEEAFKREVPLQTRKKLDLSQFKKFEKEYEKTRSNPPSATSSSSDTASSSSSSSPSRSWVGGLFNAALNSPSPPPPPPSPPPEAPPPPSPPQSPVASTQTAAPPKSPIELFEEGLKKEIASIITQASAAVPSIPESSSFTATLLFPPLASATEPVEKITPWGPLKKAAPPIQKEKPVDTSIDLKMQERLALRKKLAEEADALREEARQKQAEELARDKAAKEAAESRAKIEMALDDAIKKLNHNQIQIVIKTHEAYKKFCLNSSAPLSPKQINLLINTALETPFETESDTAEYHRAPEREMHPSPPITRAAEFAKPVENDGPTYREEDWEDEPDSMNESGVRANKEEDAIYAKLQIKLDQPGRLSKEAIEAFSLKLGECRKTTTNIAPQNIPAGQHKVKSKFDKKYQVPMQTDDLTILEASLAQYRNNIQENDE